jgi:DNA-binding transcriptional MerR regulator
MTRDEVELMTHEENGFLEYLELQGGNARLVTKSQLVGEVRDAGYKLSDRNLTFYTSANLIPHSVRAGSRAGVYPAIVIELMVWILYMRKIGVSIEALRELLPIWKFLIKSRSGHRLNLAELEYIARQHVSSPDALSVVPIVVSYVMVKCLCTDCREEITLIDRDGNESTMNDSTTIGFAIAGPLRGEDDDQAPIDKWVGRTRISLAVPRSPSKDPTTVRLGRRPNEPLPPDQPASVHEPRVEQNREEEALTT